MPTIDRQDSVLNILRNLCDLDGLKRLFWEELNYERENRPLSPRQWPESARDPLAEDPILFASGGEDNAFHVVYCRLESDILLRGLERPVVNRLTREHPYALFVFSNKSRTDWHFLNVKYDEEADKRRLLRRITVRPGEGLRTATERMQMLDLEAISPDLLGLPPLVIQQRHDDAFDVEKVTKDFYREIANWYFWALKNVTFPKDAPKERDGHDHISVIRLITRLIFCWFIREKGLIPDVLFDEPKLAGMLEGFAPGKTRNKDSVFYRAILQNLFFATLNTEMDQRGWRRADQNFMAHSLYRHKECFRDPKAGLDWFEDIPFLNGGLFECLDRDFGEGAKPRYLRVDGFSDRDDSRPTVPDFLFFGSEQEVDLSDDYGDRKFRSVRVRGLIDTLNRYKFTIEENTPLDQEVALDPELCGKVFENLLAAYNPETGTTARKATGSFYTPREIVDYMVDESLVAYLKGKLTGKAAKDPDKALRALLAYDGEPHGFDEKATEELVDAIDSLEALDPAVGSGAFPMGILHKLVLVLGKLDPDNERWKAKQIAKLTDATMREDAERLFRENYDDYGRKLYLIENCIYGVDIQPIAVQIAKMRFFISLIVDQKVNPNIPNLGVRALPNLETKFVAANTLIGIDRPAQMMLRNPEIDKKEAELRQVREKHFTARTLKSKAKCRDDDKRLRSEIAELLKNDGWDNSTAKQLAAWDPYDQNAHAEFFEAEWMFGVTDGFDIVLGNPPYISAVTMARDPDTKEQLGTRYPEATGAYDIYILFLLRGAQLLRSTGTYCWIIPNRFLVADYANKTKNRLLAQCGLSLSLDVSTFPVFKETGVYPIVILGNKAGIAPFRMLAVSSFEDLEERMFEERTSLREYRTLAEYGIGVASGATGFQARALKLLVSDRKSQSAIPFIVSGSVDRYCFSNTNVRYMGSLYREAYVRQGSAIASSKWNMWASPKIVVAGMTRVVEAVFVREPVGLGVGIYAIYDFGGYDPLCLTGLLNSAFMTYYIRERFKDKHLAGGYLAINKSSIEALPLVDIDRSQSKQIADRVRRILAMKARDPLEDTGQLEQEIDERVYKLYGLTTEEISIVENTQG